MIGWRAFDLDPMTPAAAAAAAFDPDPATLAAAAAAVGAFEPTAGRRALAGPRAAPRLVGRPTAAAASSWDSLAFAFEVAVAMALRYSIDAPVASDPTAAGKPARRLLGASSSVGPRLLLLGPAVRRR